MFGMNARKPYPTDVQDEEWYFVALYLTLLPMDAALRAYLPHNNADPKPFIWHKTADEILATVSAFCERTSDPCH